MPQSNRFGSLRRLQEQFLGDLTGRAPRDAAVRAALLATPPDDTLEHRWGIYTYGYLSRIADALRAEYRAVARILGPEAFEDLIDRYLAVCPPRSWDLARAGDRLAGFLETDRLADNLPFLPDLARLDRLLAEAFAAPEEPALAWEELRAIDPAELARLPLRLRPGVALIRSEWPLHDLWRCHNLPDDQISVPVEGRPSAVLVWRRGWTARCRPLGPDAVQIVAQAAVVPEGVSLSRLRIWAAAAPDAGHLAALLATFKDLVEKAIFAAQPFAAGRRGRSLEDAA